MGPETLVLMIATELILAALALLLLAAWIFRKQRRATSCPAHSSIAGQLATVLAMLSALAGVSLLVVVVWIWL